MKSKIGKIIVLSIGLFAVSAQVVFAHASISPKEVKVGEFKTFSLGVASEKNIATVGVRIVIPQGLTHVTPNVKPGWEITTRTEGEGDQKTITEIGWINGSIPSGQRDDFVFSAQVPAVAGIIQWKAYQVYADGSVTAWDKDPHVEQPKDASGHSDFSAIGPFSQTTVIDDLAVLPTQEQGLSSIRVTQILAGSALLVSIVALLMVMQKRS